VVLSNPHNPFGRYYARSVLEQVLQFCQQRNLHLISDEVLALSSFPSPDLPHAPPFCSALSLDPSALACDPNRVHVLWTMSKDLGASGFRVVCCVVFLVQNARVPANTRRDASPRGTRPCATASV
jgi:gliotoxin/aspirochlorine biosynthesis aminotransferase